MTAPLRVGLIGHGAAGAYIHGPLMEAAGGYVITRVMTSRPDSLVLRRDRPAAVARASELVAADDVDLVVIASPNETHFDYADQALDAGKHVVVDKPFVSSAAEADHLIAKAGRLGRVLTVFQNRRLDGDFEMVRHVLASGTLGKLVSFEARWDRPRLTVERPRGAGPGTTALWDLGPHLVDQALCLFGPPDEVVADRVGDGADDGFQLRLRCGALGCIVSAGRTRAAPRPRFLVRGRRGALVVPAYDPYDIIVRGGRHPAEPDFWAEAPQAWAELTTLDGYRRLPLSPGSWVRYYAQLAGALRDGRAPDVTPEQMRAAAVVLETAARAAPGAACP